LRFVFETSERIEINPLEEKATMGFLKREEKPPEKIKVAKASFPSHAADTNATCFKCGKAGHLQKDCKDGKTTMSQSRGFCSGCGVKGHNEAKCWKLHPELKPTGSKGTKAGDNEKDKEIKASTGDKKGWKQGCHKGRFWRKIIVRTSFSSGHLRTSYKRPRVSAFSPRTRFYPRKGFYRPPTW
jgi:hypothetical protein